MSEDTQTGVIEVPIDDVYQRDNARKLDQELVGHIARSIEIAGYLPGKEITARKDGGIYWIIDGGHRHAACGKAGRATIPVLAIDADDATTLTMEGVSNLQRPDTEEERWARCQMFFALGEAARPEIIEVATGVDADHQGRLRRAIKAIGDPVATEDVHSLDRMYAIAEFEGDAEAVKRLLNCKEGDWRKVHAQLELERKLKANVEHAERAIKKAGCELLDEEVETPDTLAWISQGPEAPSGATHARLRTYEWSGQCEIQWYGDRGPEDQAVARQREEREKLLTDLDQASRRRLEYVRDYLSPETTSSSNSLRDFAVVQWESGEIRAARSRLEETPLEEVTAFFSRIYASVLVHAELSIANPMMRSIAGLSGSSDYYLTNLGQTTSAYLEALAECGYPASPLEQEHYAQLRNALDQSATTEEETS